MTREDAIKIFEDMIRLIKQDGSDYVDARDIPLLEFIIEELEERS